MAVPAEEENVLTGQREQEAAPAAEKLPAAQGVQADLPSDAVPARHFEQAPFTRPNPAEQVMGEQDVEPVTVVVVPAEQVWQEVAPAELVN